MRYFGLATDYDGTLATSGRVSEEIINELKKFKASGRKLIMVTGRELDELMEVFPHLDIFDIVVAENGALLYKPSTKEEILLGDAPLELFVYELKKRGIERISVGRVIVATWRPHEVTVLEVIRDLGLEYQVIFNKDAVMVLPTGINKATGLEAALKEIGLSPHNIVGIGDAENDHAFLRLCECSAAVDNALPMLKEQVDYLTKADHGHGVVEVIRKVIENDLKEIEHNLKRHNLLLGHDNEGKEVYIKPVNESLLIAGTSGGGKSTMASGFIERLDEHKYQYCIIDPEGDYETWDNAVVLGNLKSSPTVEEIIKVLEHPDQNCVVNLAGIPFESRPAYFESLLPLLTELRARTGRPHWIIIDETHHLVPSSWAPALLTIPEDLYGLVLVTIHPEHVADPIISKVNSIVAIGDQPDRTLSRFAESLNVKAPQIKQKKLESGEAIMWRCHPMHAPFPFKSIPPKNKARRHRKKYAEGEMAPERSFYFTGPENKLNLKAQNLMLFIQLSEGIDDETWMHHLKKGDYSRWFGTMVKDKELASEAEKVEQQKDISPEESRRLIHEIIRESYTGSE